VTVFPFAFIWRVMLASGGRISSDEINRAVLRIANEEGVEECIARIAAGRESEDPAELGEEVVTGDQKNDRIIAWVSMASFGWVLLREKQYDPKAEGFYTIRPGAEEILRSASRIPCPHREFDTTPEYVEHVSSLAALPRDLR
jgi:hypothetical protein